MTYHNLVKIVGKDSRVKISQIKSKNYRGIYIGI